MNPIMTFFKEYQDRGKIKYQGFFLSEHTAALEKITEKKAPLIGVTRELSPKEIFQRINEAYLQQATVFVELKEKDLLTGSYTQLTGKILGESQGKILLGSHLCGIDDIRYLQKLTLVKWFQVT